MQKEKEKMPAVRLLLTPTLTAFGCYAASLNSSVPS